MAVRHWVVFLLGMVCWSYAATADVISTADSAIKKNLPNIDSAPTDYLTLPGPSLLKRFVSYFKNPSSDPSFSNDHGADYSVPPATDHHSSALSGHGLPDQLVPPGLGAINHYALSRSTVNKPVLHEHLTPPDHEAADFVVSFSGSSPSKVHVHEATNFASPPKRELVDYLIPPVHEAADFVQSQDEKTGFGVREKRFIFPSLSLGGRPSGCCRGCGACGGSGVGIPFGIRPIRGCGSRCGGRQRLPCGVCGRK